MSLKKQKKYVELRQVENEYSKVRNTVRKKTRQARKKYEQDIAINVKEHPKVVYRYMNSKTKIRPGIGKLCIDPSNPNSKTTDDDAEKAKILSEYFSSVWTEEPQGELPDMEAITIKQTMPPLVITEEMVFAILSKLEVNKSPGVDELSPKLLKEVAKEITGTITTLFKHSLREATLPEDWLTALISAIYKKGIKCLAENYRPISLTCILCKCMEKIIRDHIVNHMNDNDLFSKNSTDSWGKDLQLYNF